MLIWFIENCILNLNSRLSWEDDFHFQLGDFWGFVLIFQGVLLMVQKSGDHQMRLVVHPMQI